MHILDGADKEKTDEEGKGSDVEKKAPAAEFSIIKRCKENKNDPAQAKPAHLTFDKRRPKDKPLPFLRAAGHGRNHKEANAHQTKNDRENPKVKAR